jgi:hypothetical protein
MKTIALDFESFYDKSEYSIRHLGNWAYTHDARFDPYLLSVFDGGSSWVGDPRDFNWDACENALLLAHNAGFERAVTDRLIELGRAPTRMLKNRWACTANLSSYVASARALNNAVLVLEKRELDKGIRDWMNKKKWADIVAAGKADAVAKYALQDAQECYGLWTKYSERWPQFERDLSELTMKQCSRGVAIDVELLEKYRTILQEVIFNLEHSFPWVQRGEKPTSPKAIAEQCRMVGIPAPPVKTHDEEGFIKWEATYGPQYPWVYGAGQWRSLGKLLSALDTIKERLRPDNTIDFSLLYFGGHTGRWSGGGSGFNMQNMRKVPLFIKDGHMVTPPTSLKKKEMQEWVAHCTDYQLDIRKLFIARPGKKFILADLSQIEPRVLAWLTGNWKLLDLLKGGMSIYEAFARVAMGWTGGELKKENDDLYQLAKIQVLGLGYGCGWEKFITIAAGYDVILDEERSKEIVANFREQNPQITGLWRALDEGFRNSVGGDFQMELPSGRCMNYRNVRREVRSKKDPETGKYRPRFVFTANIGTDKEELYGGLLTENIVQATARDVFGGHLLTLEEQIGDVIFSVHDEAITEVDKDVTTRDVEHIMAQPPEWMPGLPVAAEAKEADHYLK